MSDSHPLVYGIDVHARCISNLPAEENNTVFLVGTYTLKEEGQVSFFLCAKNYAKNLDLPT